MEKSHKLIENKFENAEIDISGDARKNFNRIFRKTLKKSAPLEEAYMQTHNQRVKSRVEMMVIWLKNSLSMRDLVEDRNKVCNTREAGNKTTDYCTDDN